MGPYARIIKAAYDYKGVRLTWEECWQMGVQDNAILVVGTEDLEKAGFRWSTEKQRWLRPAAPADEPGEEEGKTNA